MKGGAGCAPFSPAAGMTQTRRRCNERDMRPTMSLTHGFKEGLPAMERSGETTQTTKGAKPV